MRRFIASLFLAGTALLAFTIPAAATGGSPPPDNTNEVPYWCQQNPGIKFDPVSTPFVVPAPPAGYTWTLLVLKAGSTGNGGVINENETFPNPVVGQSYTHSSGKDLSHAILCKKLNETTTIPTTAATTTVPQETTTVPQETTTTTTVAVTTTTVPQETTTLPVCLTCRNVEPTTTLPAPTTVPVTTVPPVKLAPPVVEVAPPAPVPVPVPAKPSLPVTGALTGQEIAFGGVLILAGLAALALTKARRAA